MVLGVLWGGAVFSRRGRGGGGVGGAKGGGEGWGSAGDEARVRNMDEGLLPMNCSCGHSESMSCRGLPLELSGRGPTSCVYSLTTLSTREGGREGEREGGKEGGREGGKEGGRKKEKEGGRDKYRIAGNVCTNS